jgi:hypothetical protein
MSEGTTIVALAVRGWDKHYENNKTRIIKNLRHFSCPNRYDNDGYIELISHQDGAAHYAAWITCLGVASRGHPRGTLVQDRGTPHDARSLSLKTRIPETVYADAIPRLLSLGWLVSVTIEDTEVTEIRHHGVHCPAPKCRESAVGGEGIGGDLTPLTPQVGGDGGAAQKQQRRRKPTDDEAANIYAAYPLKRGRKASFPAIKKAIAEVARVYAKDKGAEWEDALSVAVATLKERTERYADVVAGEDIRLPNTATWFNQARYEDSEASWLGRRD